MRYYELKAGQDFIIRGRKTPHGFIALETGDAFYKIDGDVPVSAQQKMHLTAFGRRLLWLLFGFILLLSMVLIIIGVR